MDNFKVIEFKFSKASNNHYYLISENCLYTVNRDKNNVKYLNCIEESCRCKAKIFDNTIVRSNEFHHDHENHMFKAEFESAYEELKNEVDQSFISVRDLHREKIRNLSREAAGMLSWRSVRATLQRIRNMKMPRCGSYDEFDSLMNSNNHIYETYGKIRGEAFFQGSIKNQMIFANHVLIQALREGFEMFIDGTFKVTPFNTYQLIVIMGCILGKPRPLIYIIMTGKSQDLYAAVFLFIREKLFPSNNCFYIPSAATMDFEPGLRNAVKIVWPEIEVYGCNFHFCQAIRQKALSLPGLAGKIKNHTEHHISLLMFMRLALMPIDKIMNGFNSLIEYITSDPELAIDFEEFIIYFRYTWIRLYPIKEWCVSDRRFRTNNSLEGYNCKIKQWIPIKPSPWTFLKGLHDLALDAQSDLENTRRKGTTVPDEDHSRLTPTLQILIPQLQDGTISGLDFLRRMANV